MNSPDSPMRRFRLIVENRHGALVKIVGTFSTRAYNINSLYVTPDQDEELSQLTVTLRCDDRQCDLLRKQLMKIVDVVDVQVEEIDESATDGGYENGDDILRATR
jgi:acetolactate synthase small subunit